MGKSVSPGQISSQAGDMATAGFTSVPVCMARASFMAALATGCGRAPELGVGSDEKGINGIGQYEGFKMARLPEEK